MEEELGGKSVSAVFLGRNFRGNLWNWRKKVGKKAQGFQKTLNFPK